MIKDVASGGGAGEAGGAAASLFQKIRFVSAIYFELVIGKEGS